MTQVSIHVTFRSRSVSFSLLLGARRPKCNWETTEARSAPRRRARRADETSLQGRLGGPGGDTCQEYCDGTLPFESSSLMALHRLLPPTSRAESSPTSTQTCTVVCPAQPCSTPPRKSINSAMRPARRVMGIKTRSRRTRSGKEQPSERSSSVRRGLAIRRGIEMRGLWCLASRARAGGGR